MTAHAAGPAPDHTRDAVERLATRLLARLKARRLKERLRTRNEEAPRGVAERDER